MFKTELINSFDIKPIKLDQKVEEWKGKDIFPHRKYWNLALLSKTGSGKTTVIFNLIKKFRDKHTIFLLFGSTINIDPAYKEILKWIDSQGNEYIAEPHFLNGKEDYLKDWMHEYSHAYDDEYEDDDDDEGDTISELQQPTNVNGKWGGGPFIPFVIADKKPTKKSKEKKKIEEERKKMNFIIILDDLTRDLRHNTIEAIVKKSRHYHARVILSSQSLKDLNPSAHTQIYALCLFKGLSEADLEYIFIRYAMWLKMEKFKEIYDEVIEEKKYNFLTVLPFENELRKNLNERIILPVEPKQVKL